MTLSAPVRRSYRLLFGRNISRNLKPVDVTTLPYPGFPTDLQAQMTSLMCVTRGISVVTEKVYPGRFLHVSELNRMGSHVILEGPSAIVSGVKRLSGAPVMASDLRASAWYSMRGLRPKSPSTTRVARMLLGCRIRIGRAA